jgi:hypothetical protein
VPPSGWGVECTVPLDPTAVFQYSERLLRTAAWRGVHSSPGVSGSHHFPWALPRVLHASQKSSDGPAEALGAIRSLAYFLPVIEEVLPVCVGPEHFEYLQYKLARVGPGRRRP